MPTSQPGSSLRFRCARLPARFGGMLVVTAAALVWHALSADAAVAASKRSPSPKKRSSSDQPTSPLRKATIKPVDASAAKGVRESAATIDRLVEANFEKYRVTPNPKTTDEQFVRRIYLDITGTIPSYLQARGFLTQQGSGKDSEKVVESRTRLIDALLNSNGYASRLYNYFGDVLRLSERDMDSRVHPALYNEWVRRAFEENKPYDRMVYELLATEGNYWKNPATGYLIRDAGMPLDAMSNTVRVFLGTRIGCAQCHNHPFDVWTQKQFYEMAAFTYPFQPRVSEMDPAFGGKNRVAVLKDDLKKIDPKFNDGGKYDRLLLGALYTVHDDPNKKLQLPHDYAYGDGKPDSVVDPATILGPKRTIRPGERSREVFARWLTSPENPRFARTIANRLWKLAMGRGLIEPVDDLRDDSVAENPELLDFLTAEMVRLKFDLKEYLRIIYNSEAYQRQAGFEDVRPDEPYHYPGPMLRRMTAEQVWDSFITLAVFRPQDFQELPARLEADLLDMDLKTVTAAEVLERQTKLEQFGQTVRAEAEKGHHYQGHLLVRSSELRVPLPPGHFLREFGQSDRMLIETSFKDGSITQVLQMFNGPFTHMLLEKDSLLCRKVLSMRTPEDRIQIIFLSILTRKATNKEMQIAQHEVQQRGIPGYGNVIWSLVNTREFLFVQ